MATRYRTLPSVDRLLGYPQLRHLSGTFSRNAVTDLVRRELEVTREFIAKGGEAPTPEMLADTIAKHGQELWRPGPRPVINATGVIVHTNLGRAPLSEASIAAIQETGATYSDLEFNMNAGERGLRHERVESLLRQLTGAEAALVVNNNAAAMFLALATLAQGKQVIVSRGEAVEVGGGFRIPEVISQSGAILTEVGTTNRTYIRDYRQAMQPETAALLKVHPSNFRVTGFSHDTSVADLVSSAGEFDIPVFHDLGSGCLLDTTKFGLSHEPTPQESIKAGVDLVFFSGDKLLGGPQAGIIIGKATYVERLTHHPLARALRIDKLSLAALSATLLHYVKGDVLEKVPVWRMIAFPSAELQDRAKVWASQLSPRATVISGESTIGGGSMPGEELATWLLCLTAADLPGGATTLARKLRENQTPVVGRIIEERVVLDPRTVLPIEDGTLIEAVSGVLSAMTGSMSSD
jgi:L-seryl-tRNA(Ser) seleniumtransferase